MEPSDENRVAPRRLLSGLGFPVAGGALLIAAGVVIVILSDTAWLSERSPNPPPSPPVHPGSHSLPTQGPRVLSTTGPKSGVDEATHAPQVPLLPHPPLLHASPPAPTAVSSKLKLREHSIPPSSLHAPKVPFTNPVSTSTSKAEELQLDFRVFAGDHIVAPEGNLSMEDISHRRLGFAIGLKGQLAATDQVRVEWWVDRDRKSYFDFKAADPHLTSKHNYDNLRPWPGTYEVRLLLNNRVVTTRRFSLSQRSPE